MQILSTSNNISREPPAIFTLDNKVQRPLQLPIQPLDILLLIRLRLTSQRALDGDHILSGDNLGVIANARLGVPEQALDQALLRAHLVADSQLVLPRARALAVVHAELLGHGALALPDLEVPVEPARRVGLEVDARDEGRVEPLLQPLLVEKEGVLKRVQLARQQRRARQDQARSHVVRL